MYKKTIRIGLFGTSPFLEQTLTSVEPFDNYIYDIRSYETCDTNVFSLFDIVVVTPEIWAEVKTIKLSRGIFVVFASEQDTASWDETDYNALAAIWPADGTADRLVFEFNRLQRRAAHLSEIRRLNHWLDSVIDSSPELVWFKDVDGVHLKVNDAFCAAVGKTKPQVTGKMHNYIWDVPLEDQLAGGGDCAESEIITMESGHTCMFEEKVNTKRGVREFITYKTPLFEEDGTVIGTVGVGHDITDERILEKRVEHAANTDYLTGLYNRRYLYEYVAMHRQGRPLTLVMLDLDEFKGINDTYGHHAGDETLEEAAKILKETFSDGIVTRWGGDEFVVVLIGEQDEAEMKRRATWIQRRFGEASTLRNWKWKLKGSVGIAFSTDIKDNIDRLIERSDLALYEAKRTGGSSYVIAS